MNYQIKNNDAKLEKKPQYKIRTTYQYDNAGNVTHTKTERVTQEQLDQEELIRKAKKRAKEERLKRFLNKGK